MTSNPIRIVLLDNHSLVRSGLRTLIEKQPNMLVAGEAGTLPEGQELLSSLKPDIVLVELNLPAQAMTDIVPCLIKAHERARLILVTGTTDPRIHQKAVEDGVVGAVFKTQTPEILIKAIEKVYAGEVWLERSMIANVLSRLSRNHQPSSISLESEGISQLSDREKQIIGFIGQGLKNKKIASQLFISETTVRHHLTSIYGKLGVSDRLELLVFAHRFGLVKPPTP